MANQDTAYGLRPVGLVGSGANSTGVTQYEIASDNANAIFQYSLCVPSAAGVIVRCWSDKWRNNSGSWRSYGRRVRGPHTR